MPISSAEYREEVTGAVAGAERPATALNHFLLEPIWAEGPFRDLITPRDARLFTLAMQRFFVGKFYVPWSHSSCQWTGPRRDECLPWDRRPVITPKTLMVPEPVGLTAFGAGLIVAYESCRRLRRRRRGAGFEVEAAPNDNHEPACEEVPEPASIETMRQCRDFKARQRFKMRRSARMAA